MDNPETLATLGRGQKQWQHWVQDRDTGNIGYRTDTGNIGYMTDTGNIGYRKKTNQKK